MKGDDRLNNSVTTLIIIGAVMFAVIGILTVVSNIYSLNNIKNKRVGHGQPAARLDTVPLGVSLCIMSSLRSISLIRPSFPA